MIISCAFIAAVFLRTTISFARPSTEMQSGSSKIGRSSGDACRHRLPKEMGKYDMAWSRLVRGGWSLKQTHAQRLINEGKRRDADVVEGGHAGASYNCAENSFALRKERGGVVRYYTPSFNYSDTCGLAYSPIRTAMNFSIFVSLSLSNRSIWNETFPPISEIKSTFLPTLT